MHFSIFLLPTQGRACLLLYHLNVIYWITLSCCMLFFDFFFTLLFTLTAKLLYHIYLFTFCITLKLIKMSLALCFFAQFLVSCRCKLPSEKHFSLSLHLLILCFYRYVKLISTVPPTICRCCSLYKLIWKACVIFFKAIFVRCLNSVVMPLQPICHAVLKCSWSCVTKILSHHFTLLQILFWQLTGHRKTKALRGLKNHL